MFDMRNLAKKVSGRIKEWTRDKSYDMHDVDSYRDADGEMVGDKAGNWDGSQPEEIHMTSSTAIDDVKYDPRSEVCSVKFVNGDKYYDYPDVPAEAVQNWKGKASKGRYFWDAIQPYSVNA